MALQTSGSISLSNVAAEFGGAFPASLSQYYQDAATHYTSSVSGIPVKGNPISLRQFYGASKVTYPASYAFTSAGATGATGPTLAQCIAAYGSWASSTSNLKMTTQGIQQWVVPFSGNFTITAAGAPGGAANGYSGGAGRVVTGTFTLTKNEVVNIVVGQAGTQWYNNGPSTGGVSSWGGTGGGGSFVVCADSSILLISGGGGGAANQNNGNRLNGYSAPASQHGTTQTGTLNTVALGTGGEACPDYAGAPLGGGGGYSTNGVGPLGNANGKAFVNGAIGGVGGSAPGGFGGGAGAFANNSVVYTGGGGGYTGGNSANYSLVAGGGAGSYLGTARSATGTSYGATNTGGGYVQITY